MAKPKLKILNEMAQQLDKKIAEEVSGVALNLWQDVPNELGLWREATFATLEDFTGWLAKFMADQYNPQIEQKPIERQLPFSRRCIAESEGQAWLTTANLLFQRLGDKWKMYFEISLTEPETGPPVVTFKALF